MRIIKGISFDQNEIDLFRSILPAFEFHSHLLDGIQGILASFYNKMPLLSDDIHKIYVAIDNLSYAVLRNIDCIRVNPKELDSISADGDVSVKLEEVRKFIQLGSKIKFNVNMVKLTCDTLRTVLSIAMSHASSQSQIERAYKDNNKPLDKNNISIHALDMSRLDLVRYSCGCIGFRPYANNLANYQKYASIISTCYTDAAKFKEKNGRSHTHLDELCVENISYVPTSDYDSDIYFNSLKKHIHLENKHKKALIYLKEALSGV